MQIWLVRGHVANLGGLMDPSTSSSPAASVASGQISGSEEAADPSRVRIHDRVRDTMFYI